MEVADALIVEDEDDLAHLFAKALEAAGYRPEIIARGDLALKRLEGFVPKVVVLDLNLPEVSGADILRHIRQDPRLAQTRVIIASADAQRVNALEEVADLALLKPVTYRQLRDLAARLNAPPIA